MPNLTFLCDRNGKQTGEIVDSYISKNSPASPAKMLAKERHEEAEKGPHRVLKESNAAKAKSADPVTEKAPVQKTARQQKPALRKVPL